MDPFETLTATQSPVDPFGTPPATPRPAADVADFVNAMESRWCARSAPLERRRRDRRRARQRRRSMLAGRWWSRRGARGGATGAPKARRAERASAQAEHAGTRWSHRRSADNFTVQRSAPTDHLVLNKATYKNVYEGTTYTCTKVLSYSCTLYTYTTTTRTVHVLLWL